MKVLSVLLSLFLMHESPGISKEEIDCVTILKEVARCDDFWVKVHAIEYLVDLGYHNEARALTQEELNSFSEVPEKRIGLWRISYKIATTEEDRAHWLQNIKHAYLAIDGEDRIHAAETLSKLGYSFKALDPAIVSNDLTLEDGMLYSFVLWGETIPLPGEESISYDALLGQLGSGDEQARKHAAYALSFMSELPLEDWDVLSSYALNESEGTDAYSYLIGAAYSLYNRKKNTREKSFGEIRKRLLSLEASDKKSDRIELCRGLVAHAKEEDRLVLSRLKEVVHPLPLPVSDSPMQNIKEHPSNLDVRAAAAYALIKLERKMNLEEPQSMRK